MTNKTEDKFYFGKPGQPERFGLEHAKPDTFAERKTISRKAFGKTWVIKGFRFTSTDRYEYSDGEISYHGFVPNPKNPPLVVPATLVVKPNGSKRLTVSSFNPKETLSPTVIDFSRPGQPERFAESPDRLFRIRERYRILKSASKNSVFETWKRSMGGRLNTDHLKPGEYSKDQMITDILYNEQGERAVREAMNWSRPGQPEQFGLEDACWEGYEPVGTKQKDGRTVPNCVPKDKMTARAPKFKVGDEIAYKPFPSTTRGKIIRVHPASFVGGDIQRRTKYDTLEAEYDVRLPDGSLARISEGMAIQFSRPGQPDKFDASSLNRGDFAEASTSPMLGKLLAAKVMPEGGWRAVQVGSDTLVISFEDADLASDFGRRVATKGYNATSPVQAIGRYWNVEVKNGK